MENYDLWGGGGVTGDAVIFRKYRQYLPQKQKKRWINGSFLHVQFELRFFIQWFVQHSCFPSKLSLLVFDAGASRVVVRTRAEEEEEESSHDAACERSLAKHKPANDCWDVPHDRRTARTSPP